MEVYKFETTILENGTIQVPNFQKLKSKKVEVVLLVKQPQVEQKSKEQSISFLSVYVLIKNYGVNLYGKWKNLYRLCKRRRLKYSLTAKKCCYA